MKRVSYKNIIDRQQNAQQYVEFPKLKDILVDLSVRNTPKVVRKLRLIGWPLEFIEYSDKKRVSKDKTEQVAFPDAARNKKITRIGHEDPSQCPWKAMGYIGTRKYAQRVLEEQEDGSWAPKILCKGSSVFKEFAVWELGRSEENDDTISTFLGGKSAPAVKIHAVFDPKKLGQVDYTVTVGPKDMVLTEEMINQLRAVYEPKPEELEKMRAEYEAEREEDPNMPEWEDWWVYSYDIDKIFRHTPIVEETEEESSVSESTPMVADEDTEAELVTLEDDDFAGINF